MSKTLKIESPSGNAAPRRASCAVLWLVRANIETQPGGDTTQILRTRDALAALGARITLAERLPNRLDGYDLVHFWHLDRLWEHLAACRRLRRAPTPILLSTIYWPTDEFDRHARRGFQGWLARRLGSAGYQNARMAQRFLMHAARGGWRDFDLRLANFAAAARFLLDSVAVILPNSRAEADVIVQRFGVRRPVVVTPNAVDTDVFAPPPSAAPRRGVLCVGRIEPRKNQLNLIRAMRGTGVPLTLIGAPGRYSAAYARECHSAAREGEVEFLPARAPALLRDAYQGAAVHACVSWYETPGLASLEAGACGCELVVTPGGCTREYFGEQARYADPADPASIRAAVLDALERPISGALAERIRTDFNWSSAAAATLDAYELALADRRGEDSA